MALSIDKLKELISGASKDDRNCQREIFEYLYGKMMVVCLRYTNNEDEAKDVLQEGFLKVFKQIKNYTSTGSFEGWVRRIMVNTSIDYYRKRKRNKIVYAQDDYLYDASSEVDDAPEFEFEDDQKIDPKKIMQAMAELTPAYKAVFNMYVVEGYTHKEIAGQLGISEGTSKSNLSKAKLKLKNKLAHLFKR